MKVALRYITLLIIWNVSGKFAALAAEDLPDASAVMNRVVQRAGEVAKNTEAPQYSYHKRLVVEELGTGGNVTRTTEKSYEVTLIQGHPFSRHVSIRGRELTPEEIKEENRKEEEFRKKFSGKDEAQHKKEGWVTQELISRYDFKVEGRETVNDRAMLMLSFRPKAAASSEETVQDKVLNRLAGKLWVDEKEAEVAVVKVGLTKSLSLGWFGLIGSIKDCDLELERQRLEDGTWVNSKQTVFILGRKILSSMSYRTLEESSEFKTTSEAAPP